MVGRCVRVSACRLFTRVYVQSRLGHVPKTRSSGESEGSLSRALVYVFARERESKVVLVLPRSTARAESARKDSRGVAYCSGARLFRAKGARGAFGRESRQLKRIFFFLLFIRLVSLFVRASE